MTGGDGAENRAAEAMDTEVERPLVVDTNEMPNGHGHGYNHSNGLYESESRPASHMTMTPSRTHSKSETETSDLKQIVCAVTMADFRTALGTVQPCAKREGFAVVPNVTWDDVGALVEVCSGREGEDLGGNCR